jgi:peptide chain release factor 1
MNKSIRQKLESTSDRFEEVSNLLADPEIIAQKKKFRDLSKEYARLNPIVSIFKEYQSLLSDIKTVDEMTKDNDHSIVEMGEEELLDLKQKEEKLLEELKKSLIPNDPYDNSNIYLEIRAGTGGNEAAIFAGDLFRMYSKFSESQGWSIEIINTRDGEHGGYKEIVCKITGTNIFASLKFESGTHRVQRIPSTESQGRIHTSACTVAILPEPEEVESIDINTNDLRIDTYRASGAGGQHVNKTDSAVRLTHAPSGIVVECQDERSQHKNRARAMSLLQAKLLDHEIMIKNNEQAESRKLQVGSGDRSERIRTYNYPQSRITDHRINITLYKLIEIMEGDLNQIVKPLADEHETDQLAKLTT